MILKVHDANLCHVQDKRICRADQQKVPCASCISILTVDNMHVFTHFANVT